jgi:hypothetical protein
LRTPTLLSILRAMERKSYKIFSGGSYNLNIVGIRTVSVEPNAFDDYICIFYDSVVTWPLFAFPATTDPGTYWLENPMNVSGTAVLRPMQHIGMWKLGLHRNTYKALVQNKETTVYRDASRDDTLNTDENRTETGFFGINMHRAMSKGVTSRVGKFSAGCQVIQDPIHFDFAIKLMEKSATVNGDSFTYTLLEEKDLLA